MQGVWGRSSPRCRGSDGAQLSGMRGVRGAAPWVYSRGPGGSLNITVNLTIGYAYSFPSRLSNRVYGHFTPLKPYNV